MVKLGSGFLCSGKRTIDEDFWIKVGLDNSGCFSVSAFKAITFKDSRGYPEDGEDSPVPQTHPPLWESKH